jgi:class 3 adenylate cyclase/tetratricopeptide (TPR) repeat protein
MLCASCGTESPEAAKFCGGCGAALPAACARCGHLNPRTNRFCAECGGPLTAPVPEPHFASPQEYTPRPLAEKILSSRAAMEGERKQVTVLCADVAGFTALAESLDPEDCHSIMRRCFDLMLQEVHLYEGTVCQFTGDGILALFGAPIAHEDHAQCAVRAALGIQRALQAYQQDLQESQGIHVRMRVGLNSGPVVVGAIGTDLSMTYTALGDTVNLADRVQGLAEPGTVAISQNTQRLVSGYLVTRDLGEHQVKGKEAPVRIYEALRPSRSRSRVDVSAERGLGPFVGRESDLGLLLERCGAVRTGSGQVVFIRGEAGMGKSRLLYECKRRALGGQPSAIGNDGPVLTDSRQQAAGNPLWLEGRCISYGRDISYFPIIDLLKNRFEIEEMDAEAEIARKVEAGVQALGTDLADSEPFLKYLLAVDPGDASVPAMDPQMRKARIFESLRALLIATAVLRPLVIAIEDLHWIDPLSEEFLSSLVEQVSRHPILLVLTYRGEYDPHFGSQPFFLYLDLQSLSERESAAVAEGLLDAGAMQRELQALIHRKAEGNPFFIEEVSRSLLEVGALRRSGDAYVLTRPIGEIYVPDTVQDVIMARLDRLPEEPKRALQTASVIGREFTARLLGRTAETRGGIEEPLGELQAVELICERALYPELAYIFKHALTRGVAYNSLLLARRKVLHRLVGTAIEELFRDRLEEQYETLAYHYEQGEAWEKAREYLQKSGDKAMAAFAPPQAAAYYDRALAALEKSGQAAASERSMALHYGRGQALFLTSDWDGSAASFHAMLAAARAIGDRTQEGVALWRIAYVGFWAHRFEDALDYAERAHQLALNTHDQAVLAGGLLITAFVRIATGDLLKTRVALQDALTAARQTGSPLLQGFALTLFSALHHLQGEPGVALGYDDQALDLAREHQVPLILLWVLWHGGLVRCGGGAYEGALQYLQEALDLSSRLGDKIWRCRCLNTMGWAYMDLCHWELAIQYNARGASEAHALGDPEIIRNAELNLGDCCLAVGQLAEAQRYLETVERESPRPGAPGEAMMKWRYSQHMNASLGDLWLARGDPEKALAFANACLITAEGTNSRRNIVKGRRLKGEAFLTQDKLAEADTELAEALHVAREVGNPAQLWKTLAALARLRQAQSRPEDAAHARQEAIAILEAMAAGLSDANLRATLLASPQLAALREQERER